MDDSETGSDRRTVELLDVIGDAHHVAHALQPRPMQSVLAPRERGKLRGVGARDGTLTTSVAATSTTVASSGDSRRQSSSAQHTPATPPPTTTYCLRLSSILLRDTTTPHGRVRSVWLADVARSNHSGEAIAALQ
jgi:hypothetical protein